MNGLTTNIFTNRKDELVNVPHRVTEMDVRFSSQENLDQFIKELELEHSGLNYRIYDDYGRYGVDLMWVEENHIAAMQVKKAYGLALYIDTQMSLNAYYVFKDPAGESASYGGCYYSMCGDYAHGLNHYELSKEKVAKLLSKHEK